MTVYIVVFDRSSYDIGADDYDEVRAYIDDNYAESAAPAWYVHARENAAVFSEAVCDDAVCGSAPASASGKRPREPKASMRPQKPKEVCNAREEITELDSRLRSLDESFSQMLLRKIDEKGMTDAECYKRANIDRKLFSKIRSDTAYRPSKPTAIAFAIALELPIEEMRELLMKAGYALSRSSKFDVIIEYFVQKRSYDIYEINETLFRFDQPLLG